MEYEYYHCFVRTLRRCLIMCFLYLLWQKNFCYWDAPTCNNSSTESLWRKFFYLTCHYWDAIVWSVYRAYLIRRNNDSRAAMEILLHCCVFLCYGNELISARGDLQKNGPRRWKQWPPSAEKNSNSIWENLTKRSKPFGDLDKFVKNWVIASVF